MAKKRGSLKRQLERLSIDDLLDVDEWLSGLCGAATSSWAAIAATAKVIGTKQLDGQITYWQNVASAHRELRDRIARIIDARRGKGGHGRRADTGSH